MASSATNGFDMIAEDNAPLDPEDLFAMHTDATAEEIGLLYAPQDAVHSLAIALGERRFRESRTIRRFLRPLRIADAACLRIHLGGRFLLVSSSLREPATIPAAMRRYGRAIALRVERAHRLRTAIARDAGTQSRRAGEPVAVFTPGANAVHVEGELRRGPCLETLRHAIHARESARAALRRDDPACGLELFDGVTSGRYTLVDRFERDGRRYIVAYENEPEVAPFRALTAREREILERAARGQPVKRIALDLGITPSAAGAYLASARKKTGIRSREELVRWFGRRNEPPA